MDSDAHPPDAGAGRGELHGRSPGDGRTERPALVIIPAFNEAETLGATLDSLTEVGSPIDVVVVDDGSSDATAAVARRRGVRVLRLPFNLGIGGALRTGFRFAVEHGYTRAVQFDADGQHEATSIDGLLDALEPGVDLVIGNRFAAEDGHSPASYEVGRVRAGAMGMLRLLVRQLSGQHVTDTSSGFRAFSERMLRFFAGEYPLEYLESVEALMLASSRGFAVVEVPVVMYERAGGRASQHRAKLLYHFFRLLLVLAATRSSRGAVAPTGAGLAAPRSEAAR